ncbi:hypothetical protein SADUNF_Sadunf13G0125800 [Salix dunnii]|uniref:Uncharacterized protein n=1 Tax=Salix dunnii TaxID=1413687 RepID=A0A835JGV2_9ROSI|nr:hypothetical protein SADUNF_Sadunf13G0125800 [Salix dunnii]
MWTSMTTEYYQFGPQKIDPKQVFYSTNLSYATVNLHPILLGLYFYYTIGLLCYYDYFFHLADNELTEEHTISTIWPKRLKPPTICTCLQHLYKDIVRNHGIADSISCAEIISCRQYTLKIADRIFLMSIKFDSIYHE